MATVSNVNAQSSFNEAKAKFIDSGDPILEHLWVAAQTAITAITNQALVSDDEFPVAQTSDPLVGAGGTNVLHDALREQIEEEDYGVKPLDEERLFQRMQEREERAVLAATEDVTRLFGASGFTMPTGAHAAALARVQAEGRDRVASGNREIAVAKHSLMLDAKKTVLELASKLDQTVVDTALKVLTTRLDQIKAQLQAQAALATAAMSGLNVNLGLSVSGSASVGGSESVSESSDKTAGVERKSTQRSYSESESEDYNENHNYDHPA